MPFGLTGAPATFSRLMYKVLDSLISKSCLVYLDDVIIYSKMFKETLANLKLVMAVYANIICWLKHENVSSSRRALLSWDTLCLRRALLQIH